MNKKILSLAVASATVAMCSSAFAAPTVVFGEDIHNTNTLLANPNSDAAHASFISVLSGVGTESFEGFTEGSTPATLTFPGAGTATLNGDATIGNGPDGAGRYAISGSQYLISSTSAFSISFSSNIAAFGFYGIDLGDYGGSLSLTLTDANGVMSSLPVNYTQGSNGSTNGSVVYFGFYDTADTYSSIVFNNNSGGGDTFAFDLMTVGSAQQVVATPPSGVPEPGTLALLGISALGFGINYRRRRKA